MQQPLESLSLQIAKLLERTQQKIVFAESCTGGLVSATLARVPGISNFHCGSAVVYRLDTKTKWLGVPSSMLINPGPVSEPVARAMAEGVLSVTPEADLSASITGHLGPNAPPDQDGLIFVGIAVRGSHCKVFEHRLIDANEKASSFPGANQRGRRQWAAAQFVLERTEEALAQLASGSKSRS
jgi:PncC family amidohydrolase